MWFLDYGAYLSEVLRASMLGVVVMVLARYLAVGYLDRLRGFEVYLWS